MEEIQNLKGRKEAKWEDCEIMFRHIEAARLYVSTKRTDVSDGIFIETYLKASKEYQELLKKLKNNAYFSNVIGWLNLNILEIPNLTDNSLKPYYITNEEDKEKPVEKLTGETEKTLNKSIEIQPLSKLPHANLCLLYSTDFYRKKDTGKYKGFSIKEGEIAVKIDKSYINGYRDLAVAMIRYKDFKRAQEYTRQALYLTVEKQKKLEIIEKMEQTINEQGINTKTDNAASGYLKWLNRQ
jgi:hypothetical protein